MSRAPRLLVVSPVASHPADQGNSARIQTLGAALMARGVVCDFLYYATEGCSPAQREAMAGFWHALHVLPPVATGPSGMPGVWALDDWCDESLVERVAQLQRRWPRRQGGARRACPGCSPGGSCSGVTCRWRPRRCCCRRCRIRRISTRRWPAC